MIKVKEATTETREWCDAYFMRFLYEIYPPPRKQIVWEMLPPPQPLSKLGLLFEPRSHEEVVFPFSKLHEKVGFPYITLLQATYPDIYALDIDRAVKRIEVEVYASQFNHDPKGCDFIVCWENDLETKPEDWPEIIQLKDHL